MQQLLIQCDQFLRFCAPIYNVGNQNAVNLMDYIKMLESGIGRKAVIQFVGAQPGDVLNTLSDSSRLAEELEFVARVPLEQGIRRFINWYNVFLATKISFINEISALCEAVNADVHAVARGMGLDGRIGGKLLHPGPGYGGSCFPKDTRALVRIAQENNVTSRIVEAVMEVNEAQKARMISKIRTALGGSENGKTLAVLGLAFKPETDDMRDAPALSILPKLIDNGARIQAHEPQAMPEAKALLPESTVFLMTSMRQYPGWMRSYC